MKKFLHLLSLASLFTSAVSVNAAESALPRLVQVVNSSNDPQFQLDVLRGMSVAMEGRTTVPMPVGWEAVEAKLSGSSDPEIRSLTQSLGLKFGSAIALDGLKSTLQNRAADAGERRNALAALLAVKDPELPELLQSLLNDPVVRGESIRALAAYNDSGTPAALIAVYPSLDVQEKRDVANTLASRAAYAEPLMIAVEEGIVEKETLTADLLRQLRSLRNEQINAAIEKVYGTFRESSADRQKDIEMFKRVYYAGGSTPGDAPRGRVVFNRICAQCHTLFDTGGKIGPDLTGSNRADLDYILQNMVDPNAVIPNEYRTSSIEMKDDRVITGIIKSQNQSAITVATANDTLILPRDAVSEIYQSELSMMPEGLLDTLTETEVRDLIYYLRQAAQAKLPD